LSRYVIHAATPTWVNWGGYGNIHTGDTKHPQPGNKMNKMTMNLRFPNVTGSLISRTNFNTIYEIWTIPLNHQLNVLHIYLP
jgi:hypothetical protein